MYRIISEFTSSQLTFAMRNPLGWKASQLIGQSHGHIDQFHDLNSLRRGVEWMGGSHHRGVLVAKLQHWRRHCLTVARRKMDSLKMHSPMASDFWYCF